jgi:hypothetical protein
MTNNSGNYISQQNLIYNKFIWRDAHHGDVYYLDCCQNDHRHLNLNE